MNSPFSADYILQAEELSETIGKLPRLRLTHLPTPLEECPRISTVLGGLDIRVKRDDLTGLAFGGTKTRMMEFVMADAIENDAQVVIAGSPIHCNHPRLAAASIVRAGLKPVLVLWGSAPTEMFTGNLLLDHLLGADIHVVENQDYRSNYSEVYEEIASGYNSRGEKPYVIDLQSSSVPLAAVGTVNLALELWEQFRDGDWFPDHIFVTTTSGGTQSGLVLGAKCLGFSSSIIGVSLREDHNEACRRLAKFSNQTATLLGLDVMLSEDDILLDSSLSAEGDRPSQASIQALRLMAETEAIFLSPGYTGKIMASLLGMKKRDEIKDGSKVLLIHTGGTPEIFEYSAVLAPNARDSVKIHHPKSV